MRKTLLLKPLAFLLALLATPTCLPAGATAQETARKNGAKANASGATKTKSRDSFCADGLPNLDLVKEELIKYHDCTCDCGCYADDLARVGNQALAYLKSYVQAHKGLKSSPGRMPAIVLDIDETALSNWENEKKTGFAYSFQQFKQWEQEMKAPAIQPTLNLFRFARNNGLATLFITGRAEEEREITAKDLESAGYKDWTALIMRQPGPHRTAAEFKSGERKRLREAGYLIVLNIGDQESDLAGEPALKSFKLPNPFYYLP